MGKPLISIIVPCYNQSLYMRDTLDCLKNQTYQNWECIIVNDGSTDNTLDIAKEYITNDHRYILVDKANGGLADARNAGIRASHGRYILPLDSDDLIGPTYTGKAVAYLEQHPEIKLVYCRAKFFGDRNDEWILPAYNYDLLLYKNHIFCSCIYRRSDYDKTSGYNPNMLYGWEDWDFLLSLLEKNNKVYQIPEILFFYRKHGNSMLTTTNQHSKYLYNQLISNHIDIYYPLLYKIITSEKEIKQLESNYFGIKNSRSYKLGHTLLKPLRFIKKYLNC